MLPVRITSLSKHFGSTVAVDGVDLEIPAGALFFLLGPSGCGKTTLLRMLAGFTDPTRGAIHFGEREVTHLPAEQRNTGMCFQSYALWPHMTVAQNVAFGLEVRHVPALEKARRVGEALELVQMGRYAARKPNELSGGQQQRVALARALVIRPDLLLLDEPLSNLDARLRLEMRGQIRSICQQAKITTVYVTHDQKEALSMADRMAVLREGRVVQVGLPGDLYRRPGSRFVADFLGETNFLPATVAGVAGDELRLETPAGPLQARGVGEGLTVGRKVTCSIRPEALRLVVNGSAASAGGNVLAGRRQSLTYLGEMAQHEIRLAGDVAMKVFELNPHLVGDEGDVRVTFDPADVVVLAE